MDPSYCVILNLALWLEVFLGLEVGSAQRLHVFAFSNDLGLESAATKTKNWVYNVLRPILVEMGLDTGVLDDGPLGSHSVRKYSSTWVRSNGIPRDDKDYCGRWKSRTCGGPGLYHTGEWIESAVAPNITAVYGPELGRLFGRALLWLACSQDTTVSMPTEMRDCIKRGYLEECATLDPGTNPVAKKLVHVSGRDAQVFMEILDTNQTGEQQAPEQGTVAQNSAARLSNTQASDGLLLSILSQGNQLHRSIIDLQTSVESVKGTQRTHTQIINCLVPKIDTNPINMLQRNANPASRAAAAAPPRTAIGFRNSTATLAPHVRTLPQLWEEYQTGLGGRKPARDFNRTERGRCKFMYSQRKYVGLTRPFTRLQTKEIKAAFVESYSQVVASKVCKLLRPQLGCRNLHRTDISMVVRVGRGVLLVVGCHGHASWVSVFSRVHGGKKGPMPSGATAFLDPRTQYGTRNGSDASLGPSPAFFFHLSPVACSVFDRTDDDDSRLSDYR
eukprot:scaffold6568_cov173-Amphora_coffeaeformis.AAC.1